MPRRWLDISAAAFAMAGLSLFPGCAGANQFDTAEVHTMPGGDKVNGAAWLIRSDEGVAGSFETSGLNPGDAVTMWWVIFNNPDACDGPCGADDLASNADANPNVVSSILWADGAIVGQDGVAHFRSRLTTGTAPGQVVHGPGLLDPYKAEVHLVLRTHGTANPDSIAVQLTTAEGGCTECPNVQAAAFKAAPTS